MPDIAELYETHFRYVWRCLRSLGVRDALLDDALQDVFIVAQRRLPEFDGAVAPGTWLYAIALRIARKYRVRQRNDPSLDELTQPELVAPGADGEANLQRAQRLQLARAALETLDDEKREVFVLARVEQMSAPEIAGVVGVPLNTVYSRLRAARLAFEAEVRRLEAAWRKAP
ncbi:MAG: sigma-70 family RNA polymerase sigma factor [Polyangiaceae bacterium]